MNISGAIDMAAKSAGIIPASPCRDVEAPSIDKALVHAEEAINSTPAAPEREPDLLDQEPSEVRQKRKIAFLTHLSPTAANNFCSGLFVTVLI